jgi:arsenate reductase
MSRVLLFLCVANSARSQMAEGLAREILGPDVEVHSAGSEPSTLNPLAVRALAERGIDISSHSSKGLDAVPLDRVDTVVTLCAEEVCPTVPPGTRHLHLPMTDPAAVAGSEEERLEAFRGVRDEIETALRMLSGETGLAP